MEALPETITGDTSAFKTRSSGEVLGFLPLIASLTQAYLENRVPLSRIILPFAQFNQSIKPVFRRFEITLAFTDQWQWCYAPQLSLSTTSNTTCTPSATTEFAFTSNTVTVFVLSLNQTNQTALTNAYDILPQTIKNGTTRLYTPADLALWNVSGLPTWPMISDLLQANKRTLLVFANATYVPSLIDSQNVFNASVIPSTLVTVPMTSQTIPQQFNSPVNMTSALCSLLLAKSSATSSTVAFPAIIETVHAFTSNASQNYLDCGITTLTSQDLPYIWTWDVGQPVNTTQFDCAILQLNGRFRNVNCMDTYQFSCLNQTYVVYFVNEWTIKTNCGADFSVPRTGFEVVRLLEQMRDIPGIQSSGGVYINLHQSVSFCWTSLGDPCPYAQNGSLIPQIIQSALSGGIIILVLGFWFVVYKIAEQVSFLKERSRKMDVRRKLKLLDVNGTAA